MISLRFCDRRAALDAARTIQGDVFPAFLRFLGVAEPERFSVVEIAETTVPNRGHKLTSRTSRLSDRQWTKVVQRTLEATSAEDHGGIALVTLIAGEAFDHTAAAGDLPPNFPKSSLKGIAPGPVQITTTLLSTDPRTTITIRQVSGARPTSTVQQWWPLAVTALHPIAEHPDFEMATIRPADSGDQDDFDPDPDHAPVIVVCGPAAAEEQRAELAASATSTIGTEPLVGMYFEPTR